MTLQDLSRRSTDPELMDSEEFGYEDFEQCLRHLEWVNILTLAYRPTRAWFRQDVAGHVAGGKVEILDVGGGGGDMLRHICRWARRMKVPVSLVGADINPWAKKAAEACTLSTLPIRFETADVFALNPSTPPDFIISSLFAHHLRDPLLVEFLRWMDRTATRGWLINDLHRHPLPYYFIKGFMKIVPFNHMVRHDASVSVARAFTKADWVRLLKEAGIAEDRIRIRWFFPFRYSVSCRTR